MKRPFDPILKTLAELSPADWLPFAGRRRRRVTVEDSDIGTIVSGATDKLFRVSPAADSPQWNGLLERGLPGEDPVSTLRYQVVRVWQLPVEQVLQGGIGTLALAPITNVAAGDVRRVVGRMKERLSGPSPARRAADVRAATYVLLGLRYSDELARAVFEEVLTMKESVTYQAIVREAGTAEVPPRRGAYCCCRAKPSSGRTPRHKPGSRASPIWRSSKTWGFAWLRPPPGKNCSRDRRRADATVASPAAEMLAGFVS